MGGGPQQSLARIRAGHDPVVKIWNWPRAGFLNLTQMSVVALVWLRLRRAGFFVVKPCSF